ncbi:MAG: hypothetical protein ACOH2K_06890 [Burkholderiaceae bacterium]
MAAGNPYVGRSERNFVNDVDISPLNFLKFPVFFYANRVSVIQGGRYYARKESNHRCRPLVSVLRNHCIAKSKVVDVPRPIAVVLNRHFGMPPVFLLTSRPPENQRRYCTPKNKSTALDASF